MFATRGAFRGSPVDLATLPPHLADAVLAIEDRRFRSHLGVDLRGIGRALVANLTAGGVREGGSTITQQLARLLYLSQERTLRRKLQEAMLAVWLELRLSKDEILERYLNGVYFGAGAYGVEGAARRYFRKPARELSLSEAAMLAGLIQAPSDYAPTRDLTWPRSGLPSCWAPWWTRASSPRRLPTRHGRARPCPSSSRRPCRGERTSPTGLLARPASSWVRSRPIMPCAPRSTSSCRRWPSG